MKIVYTGKDKVSEPVELSPDEAASLLAESETELVVIDDARAKVHYVEPTDEYVFLRVDGDQYYYTHNGTENVLPFNYAGQLNPWHEAIIAKWGDGFGLEPLTVPEVVMDESHHLANPLAEAARNTEELNAHEEGVPDEAFDNEPVPLEDYKRKDATILAAKWWELFDIQRQLKGIESIGFDSHPNKESMIAAFMQLMEPVSGVEGGEAIDGKVIVDATDDYAAMGFVSVLRDKNEVYEAYKDKRVEDGPREDAGLYFEDGELHETSNDEVIHLKSDEVLIPEPDHAYIVVAGNAILDVTLDRSQALVVALEQDAEARKFKLS